MHDSVKIIKDILLIFEDYQIKVLELNRLVTKITEQSIDKLGLLADDIKRVENETD